MDGNCGDNLVMEIRVSDGVGLAKHTIAWVQLCLRVALYKCVLRQCSDGKNSNIDHKPMQVKQLRIKDRVPRKDKLARISFCFALEAIKHVL
jgi:hypothetical protein